MSDAWNFSLGLLEVQAASETAATMAATAADQRRVRCGWEKRVDTVVDQNVAKICGDPPWPR